MFQQRCKEKVIKKHYRIAGKFGNNYLEKCASEIGLKLVCTISALIEASPPKNTNVHPFQRQIFAVHKVMTQRYPDQKHDTASVISRILLS